MQEAQSFSSTCGVKTLQVSSTTLLFHYSSCCLLCTQITFFLYFLLEFCNYPPFPFTDSCLLLYSAFLQGLPLFPLFYKPYPSSFPFYLMLHSPPHSLHLLFTLPPYWHHLPTYSPPKPFSCASLFMYLPMHAPPLPMSYWLTPSPLNPKHPTDLPHPQLVLYIT